ncbi:hypothetical protein RJ639_005388 [Escallonia herrerae]|uniref:Protein kinase domain-containing protein n=1 Tax=Escallonia herrerae TaxID=1293975 RepID=A0AA88VU65_9ASTE|nr:hypothetical protein RJ639_005388 [Escallonia herrerae]
MIKRHLMVQRRSIPAWIGNFSSLTALLLIRNNFYGSVPYDLGRLSSLRFLELYANQLSGSVPDSIFNISSIYYFTVTQNHLQGQLPPDVGLTLPNLEIFAGGVNEFSGPIPVSLSNATKLEVIDFAENRLTGGFPTNLGKLQGLYRINFDENRLGQDAYSGFFFDTWNHSDRNWKPDQLDTLGLEENNLTGSVPDVIGKLQHLQGLSLNANRFSGQISSTIGNLTSLTSLLMEDNRLEGSIPPSLVNCRSLLVMNLTGNNLSGTIPKEVAGLSSLSISLAMAHNSLTGSLPLEVGRLGKCQDKGFLLMQVQFQSLEMIKLCSGVQELHLPHCSGDKSRQSKSLSLKVVIPVTASFILVIILCSFAACYMIRRPENRPLTASSPRDWQLGTSYSEMVQATNGFSEENLVGSGSFGSVYKGVVHGYGAVVAVKVIYLHHHGASKSFMDEIKALRGVHHRNLLKIISACSSKDHQVGLKGSIGYIPPADPSLLSGEEDNIDEDQEGKAKGNVTRKMKDGLASLFRIGLSCSGTLPGDRMPLNAVVNQMLATRDLFLSLRDTKKSRFEVGGSSAI